MIKLTSLISEAGRLSYDEFTHQIQPGQKYKDGIEIVGVSGIVRKGAKGRMPTGQIITYKDKGKEKKEKIKQGDKRFSYSNLLKEAKKPTNDDFVTGKYYELVTKNKKFPKVMGQAGLHYVGGQEMKSRSILLHGTIPYRAKGISIDYDDIISWKEIKPFKTKPPKRKDIYM